MDVLKKRCSTCHKFKILNNFHKNPKTKDGRQSKCILCTKGYIETYLQDPKNLEKGRERARQHYTNNKEKKKKQVCLYTLKKKQEAIALLGGVCQKCGFDHPAALQFHHRDPSTKLFGLSVKTLAMPSKYPWEVIEAEIAKCDLLCANCHAVHHSTWTEYLDK